MKKILIIAMAVLLTLSFAGCNKDESSSVTEDSSAKQSAEAETISEEPASVDVESVITIKSPYKTTTYSDHEINELGQVVKAIKKEGNSTYTVTYEYDDAGKLIKETTSNYYGDEVWTYTYDESGLLISEFQGDREFENTYTFDESGRISTKTMVNVTSDDNYTTVYSYTYNEDGSIATETQTSPSSTYVIEFEYDEKGRVVREDALKEGESIPSVTTYTYGVVGSYTPSK